MLCCEYATNRTTPFATTVPCLVLALAVSSSVCVGADPDTAKGDGTDSSEIPTITMTPASNTRVLISTKHDDVYFSSDQTEDRKIRIVVTYPAEMDGQTLYFDVVDPDDPSSYETDTNGDDNRDENQPKGSLSVSQVSCDATGRAEIVLTVTAKCSGDNYIVRTKGSAQSAKALAKTAIITAWKRIYIERDKMYRCGTYLSSNFSPDGNSLPDTLAVDDASLINVGDTVIVFDSKTAGEPGQVTATTATSITLDVDLQNSYDAGQGWGDEYAAVAVPSKGYYEALTDKVASAYGYAYVDVKVLPNGSHAVPLDVNQDRNQRDKFRDEWFANKSKSNYIYLCGAELSSSGVSTFGLTDRDRNQTFVYWMSVGVASEDAKAKKSRDSTVHELAHQFGIAAFTMGHVDLSDMAKYWNHEHTDACVMDYDSDGFDGPSQFCTDCLYHIRSQSDDL